MKTFNEKLNDYAKLTIQVGINLQTNQMLYITSPVESVEFARMLVDEAFNQGAKDVYVEWVDEQVRHSRLKYTESAVLEDIPQWVLDRRMNVAKENGAFLTILAEDPELMKDIDADKISSFMKNVRKFMKPYGEFIMGSTVSWSIVSVPSAAWAMKVFNNAPDSVEQLWDSIFKVVRADQDDPIKAWQNHVNNLKTRKDFLNDLNLKSLHFKSEFTDLKVELPKEHNWQGGGKKNASDVLFVANIPTEEVFTLPHRLGVNGKVKSTLPLNYMGNLITDIVLEFKDGKVIDFSATNGYDVLKGLLETDEGAHHLGEVALVPYHSPISDLGILFYNTLFDENASCHLAFGRAYPTSLNSGNDMNEEERIDAGANFSLVHVDFMIGSPDMSVIGELYDKTQIQIFKDGDWAI